MTKPHVRTSLSNRHSRYVVTLVVAAALAAATGIGGFYVGRQNSHLAIPSENRPGYITAAAAKDQVDNFYVQYLQSVRSGTTSQMERQKYLIKSYGSANLVFYRQYYQHGFDPITCSERVPQSVRVTRAVPGPGATVTALATYSDGTTSNIVVMLVINNEGFKIDNVNCPGGKGNLAPAP